mmetsp:Transcript_10830/g.17639  ORF Transcript_10830/g.17639 Transcript_10830/m.17639 type:complete len:537 (+) Transcript_10830:188-1798(+)
MGNGASALDGLSSEQKAALTRLIEEKYESLKNEGLSEEQIYNTLRDTFLEGQQSIAQQDKAAEIAAEHVLDVDENEAADTVDENEFKLKGSIMYQPFSSASAAAMVAGSSGSSDSGVLKSQSSSQLLDLVNTSIQDDQQKIADFISQIKSGEVVSKSSSNFRQRRLTYGTKTEDEVAAATVTGADATTNTGATTSATSTSEAAASAAVAPISRRNTRPVRTTIFASSEIGIKNEKTAPFPNEVLGTYSCHGIEPSYEEVDGIHEKINQDRGCVVCPYNQKKNEAFFMVLDGHGDQGDKVSEFVMRQVVISLEKDPQLAEDPTAALKSAFIQTNTALLVTKMNYMTSGCTAVGVYVRDKKLWVANVGDSRAVMACTAAEGGETGKLVAKDLSRDHKPDDPEEMERIISWGGFVCPPPEEGLSARVYLDPEFTMIGLAMARSIGDHAVKAVGVIPEPEVKIFDLEPVDQFMIMASDGVWEFISSQEAVDIVQSQIHRGCHEACQYLIEKAATRWQEEEGDYRDDITAVVVKFPLPFEA